MKITKFIGYCLIMTIDFFQGVSGFVKDAPSFDICLGSFGAIRLMELLKKELNWNWTHC